MFDKFIYDRAEIQFMGYALRILFNKKKFYIPVDRCGPTYPYIKLKSKDGGCYTFSDDDFPISIGVVEKTVDKRNPALNNLRHVSNETLEANTDYKYDFHKWHEFNTWEEYCEWRDKFFEKLIECIKTCYVANGYLGYYELQKDFIFEFMSLHHDFYIEQTREYPENTKKYFEILFGKPMEQSQWENESEQTKAGCLSWLVVLSAIFYLIF